MVHYSNKKKIKIGHKIYYLIVIQRMNTTHYQCVRGIEQHDVTLKLQISDGTSSLLIDKLELELD